MAERTQAEILERFKEAANDDFFGFRREVLAGSLALESLAEAGIDASDITEWNVITGADLEAAARSYLEFAIGKIEEHRGISASRSVDKLREYAWLMGRDDVVAAMDAEEYPLYGAPQVRAFAKTLSWPWPDGEEADVMANGEPCRPDCEDGCGQ